MLEPDHETAVTPGAQVVSLGCRLNAAEGEAMERLAADAGMAETIIINSCAVTNEAVRQTRQQIRRARRSHPNAFLVVTGCAAQIDAASFAGMAAVDAVLGNSEKMEAGTWRRLAERGKSLAPHTPVLAVDDIMSARQTALAEAYGERARAFLQIQNGCNHRCTFCIIPFGRGNARSAPIADVVEAARLLVERGRAEIVLTGVDITSWGADLDGQPQLGALVGAVLDGVPALKRLRLSSIDGAEIDPALFERIVSEPRLAPHVHLSLQSGDDLILKRMKRRHTRVQSIDLCSRIKSSRPEVALGADLIAGFPTETEGMFENSRSLIDDAALSYVHVFPYSAREGTPAARMPQLDSTLINARAAILRADAGRAKERFLDGLLGRDEDVVVEAGKIARLGNFAVIRLSDGAAAAGEMVRARVTGREGDALVGSISA